MVEAVEVWVLRFGVVSCSKSLQQRDPNSMAFTSARSISISSSSGSSRGSSRGSRSNSISSISSGSGSNSNGNSRRSSSISSSSSRRSSSSCGNDGSIQSARSSTQSGESATLFTHKACDIFHTSPPTHESTSGVSSRALGQLLANNATLFTLIPHLSPSTLTSRPQGCHRERLRRSVQPPKKKRGAAREVQAGWKEAGRGAAGGRGGGR